MAKLATAINIAEVDRSADRPSGFDLLPFGDYVMELTAIDPRPDGDNIAHNYTYEVIEPEAYKGRRIWDWIDIVNDTEWKQARGLARIAKLADAVGYDPDREGLLDDDDKLLYRAFLAKVIQTPAGVSKNTGKEFKAGNKVDDFYNPNSPSCPAGPSILDPQPVIPTTTPTAANDNRPQAANDNRPAPAAAASGQRRPWGSK